MTKGITKIFFFVLCFMYVLQGLAQQRTCGLWNPANQSRNSPTYHRLHQQKLDSYEQFSKRAARQPAPCSSPTQLPIAIHFQEIDNPDVACLRALAENQVSIINRDLNGQNPDTIAWLQEASFFEGTSLGTVCLEFVLANQNHPTGYGISDGEIAVTFNRTNGDFLPDWAGYVNIVVRGDILDLGYAPLGGIGNGDAITINTNAFGTFGCGEVLPQAPYNLGRTVVHEMGHYLFLNHIWANSFEESGCWADDGIADTPISKEPHFGCPSLIVSCSSTDLHMNYMDYVFDECMYMFTAGQAVVMKNWVTSNLSFLVNRVSSVYNNCIDCLPPSCEDKDLDGYCLELDCDDEDSTIPAASGSSCDDGNPNTYNDLIQLDGCACAGTINECLENGGDTDADGICDNWDCQPFDDCFPKPVNSPCDDGNSQTTNDQIQSDGCTCLGIVTVQATLLLEGFLEEGSQTMTTVLNRQSLLPIISPYLNAPWNYSGQEQITAIPTNAVDWILVMARDEQDQIISKAVGFLSNQGQLLSIDGSVGIDLVGGYGNFLSIHHRNHLAVVSATPYFEAINFMQSADSVKGNQQLKQIGGSFCLFAGDFDGSGIVNNQDYNQWITKKSVLNQYLPVDGDGNGIVNNLDYNLWVANGAKIGYEGIHY